MKVVLAYDEPLSPEAAGHLPEDFGAEYDSARTIEALLESIRACGYEAVGLALSEDFPQQIRRLEPGLVFNIAEGIRGPTRESVVPAWLDHLGIPYTGSDGLTLAVSLDKALTKTLVSGAGLRTPAFRRVRCMADLGTVDLEFPLFVKPNAEGSSMGVRPSSLVETEEQLKGQAAWILQMYREDCLVEEFAPGREFCVGILGNDEAEVFPIVEICSGGNFYPYEKKHGHQRELICPARITPNLAEEMCRAGRQVFKLLGCRDLARVDFKLDNDGRPTFLEINPLPGLSPHYGIFVYQAQGLSHEELIGRIIDSALVRTRDRKEREELEVRVSKQAG